MLRSIQASFRQFRGLNVNERLYKIWIKYFTQRTNKYISSVPKNSTLNAHYLNFNFSDVNEKVLYTEGDFIEENPGEALPVLFNFQQPISKHYFDFFKLLSEEKENMKEYRVIVFETHPHMMRCLIAFTFQIQDDVLKYINRRDTAFFPLSFIDNFPYLVEHLLTSPPEIRADFLFLFAKITELLNTHLNQIICKDQRLNEFSRTTYKIFCLLINFFKSNNFDLEDSAPCLTFVIKYFFSTFSFNKESPVIKKTLPEFCSVMAKSEKLRNLLSKESYSKLFELISLVFNYISSLDNTVERKPYVDIVLPILQMIISLMPANRSLIPTSVGKNGIMSPIVKLVEWVAKTEVPNEIEIPDLQENGVEKIQPSEVSFKFIEQNFIDKNEFEKDISNDTKDLSTIQPTYLQNSPLVISILFQITGICSKDKSMLSDFIVTISKSFTETKSLKIQYIGSFGLFTTRSKDFAQIMDQTNSWKYFITPTIFNKYTFSGNCSEHLVNLKDMILSCATIAFTSDYENRTSLLSRVEKLIKSNDPILVAAITNFFNKLIKINYDIFVDCAMNTNIIDTLFSYYIKYKDQLMEKSDKVLIEARTQIAIFIKELMENEKACKFMYKSSLRANTLISMVFEEATYQTAISIIMKCLSTLKTIDFLSYIVNAMREGIKTPAEPKWKAFLSDMTSNFFEASKFNHENIVKFFVSSGCLATFCMIPAAYVDENLEDDAKNSIIGVLKLLVILCKYEPAFQETLSSSTSIIRGNLKKTLKYITIDDSIVNLLLSLTTNSDANISTLSRTGEISCVEGLSLLSISIEGTKYLDDITKFLAEITKSSIANRYQCFRANIIQYLLNIIPHNHSDTIMQLFSQLGASFFRMGELSMTIRLLKDIKQDYVLPLLQSLITMTDKNDELAPKALLHFGKGNPEFTIPPFQINKNFTMSALFNFELETIENSQEPVHFMSMVADQQRIDFTICNKNIIISIKDGKKVSEFNIFNNIAPNIWKQYTIGIDPKHIYAYIGDESVGDFEIENRFKFNSNVAISISGANINIENLFLYNSTITPQMISNTNNTEELKKIQQIAHFSANRFLNKRCINQIYGSFVKSATFNSLVVPFSISLIDAIPTCGGPIILLPLLELAEESPEPSKYLFNVLKLISRVAKVNQQSFIGQRFFRSLGHLLLTLNKDIVSEIVIDELYITYKELTITSLKCEMIRYVWGDFAIWTHMSENIQFFVFTGIFTGLIQIDAKLISQVIPFREFLKRFTTIFSRNLTDNSLINRCWSILLLLAQKYFTIEDAKALITTVISTQDEYISMASIELLRNLLTDNTEAIITLIKENKFFTPFTQLVNAQNETLRLYGVHMMYYIQVKADFFDLKEDLCDEMINVIRLYYHVDQTDVAVNLVLGYIYGIPDHTMWPSKSYKFDFNYQGPIKYPQFIPLLTSMLTYIESKDIYKISEFIRNNFINFEESCIEMVKCSNWQFWILFFQFLDHKLAEWEVIFNKLFLAKCKFDQNYDPSDDLTKLELICKSVNINSTHLIRGMLKEVMEKHPTLEVLHYSLRFILYVDANDFDLNIINRIPIAPMPDLDVIQAFAQNVITFNLITNEDIVYTRLSETDPWPDFSLAIRCAKYMISLNPKMLVQNIPIVQNLEISYAAVLTILMSFIYKQSSPDAELIIKLLINQFAKCTMKELLVNPIIALLDIYSYKCEESELLINLLHISDKMYQSATIETVNDLSEGIVQTYTGDVKLAALQFAKTRNQRLIRNKETLERILNYFFVENEEEHKLLELKQVYNDSVEDLQLENERIIRGNAKFWMRMMKKMHNQVGGPWTFELSDMTHFKFSNTLDSIGRRVCTKINHKFDNHLDASSLRDNSDFDVEEKDEKSIYVENQEPTDTDEPNKRLNTLQIDCRLITTTVFIKGTLFIGNNLVAFESSSATNSVGQEVQIQKIIEIGLEQISFILKRKYLHIDNSAELFTTQDKSYFFVFQNSNNRLQFMKQVKQMKPPNLRFIQFKDAIKFYHEMNLQKRWMCGDVSNFEYLMWLNLLAGRSIHDLSQYPVFPWVIKDYKSESINLEDESIYRDLSKPIGALNEERLEKLLFLYNETKDEEFSSLYRFHYSTPAYIIGYLIRMEPFTSLHIALQSGKFDHPNRLFFSIPCAWNSVVSKQPDFRELSPEFFSTPDFLYNSDKFDLGVLDDKVTRVDDVELPPWAHNPAEFIAINRLALESKYVSEHINEWIDLVFGFSSRGINAEKAYNVFHPYSYSNIVTSSVLNDPAELNIIQQHAANFGIVPDQLFQQPHLQRKFIPTEHKLQRTKMCFFETQHITKLYRSVLAFTPSSNNTIWILYNSGEYAHYSLEDMTTPLEQVYVKLSIPSDLATPAFFRKHLGLVESKGHIFLTTPLSTEFQLIDVVDKKGKVLYTVSEHSVPITTTAIERYGKEYYAVTAAGDSSILAWDLEKHCQKCKIVAHTFSIVDVDISVVSRLVASIDTSGMLVMSSLINGSYIHSVQFDTAPTHVRIAPLGFVVLFFEKHEGSLSTTNIVVVDNGGKIVTEKQFEGNMTALSMIELKDSSCYIAFASDTKFITIVRVYDLEVKSRGCIMDTVDEIEYSKEDGRLLLLTRNGDFLKYEIYE